MDINIISKKEEREIDRERMRKEKSEHIKRSDRREAEKEGNKIWNKEHVQRMLNSSSTMIMALSHIHRNLTFYFFWTVSFAMYYHYKLLH